MSGLLKGSHTENTQRLLSHQQSSGRAPLPQTSPRQLWERLGFSAAVGVSACSEGSVLSPGVRSLFTVEHRFSQTQAQGYSELFSLCTQECVLAQNAPALHRILKHNCFSSTKIKKSTKKNFFLKISISHLCFFTTLGIIQIIDCKLIRFLCSSSYDF